MFPSPKLGLSLKFNFEKYINAVDEKFPSPKLGLSLKSAAVDTVKAFENMRFPSPKLGLSLKSCPCKSACHKACAHHLRRKPYQQTTCPKNNLPHTLQIHSASGAAQFHSKSFIQ